MSTKTFAVPTDPLNDVLAQRSYHIWSAGDYDRIAAGFRTGAAEFVRRRNLRPGLDVLDVACGSGNATIPAAHAGARVTGLDLVPSLLERARMWAGYDAVTPEGVGEMFRAAYGPTVRTFEALDVNQRASLSAALAAHWRRYNRNGGPATVVHSEYLEVVALRR